MENKDMLDENKAKQAFANSLEVNNMLISALARIEASNILINVLNAIFSVTQKDDSEHKISNEIVGAIQNAINEEGKKTDDLYTKIAQALNAKKENKEAK